MQFNGIPHSFPESALHVVALCSPFFVFRVCGVQFYVLFQLILFSPLFSMFIFVLFYAYFTIVCCFLCVTHKKCKNILLCFLLCCLASIRISLRFLFVSFGFKFKIKILTIFLRNLPLFSVQIEIGPDIPIRPNLEIWDSVDSIWSNSSIISLCSLLIAWQFFAKLTLLNKWLIKREIFFSFLFGEDKN